MREPMPRFVIAPAAEQDVESILGWSHERFGEQARFRYEALLVQAMVDIADRPDLPASQARPEIAAGARTYHLVHSRTRVSGNVGRVAEPRHFLLYRTRADGVVEIGRILHDSMDLNAPPPGRVPLIVKFGGRSAWYRVANEFPWAQCEVDMELHVASNQRVL